MRERERERERVRERVREEGGREGGGQLEQRITSSSSYKLGRTTWLTQKRELVRGERESQREREWEREGVS